MIPLGQPISILLSSINSLLLMIPGLITFLFLFYLVRLIVTIRTNLTVTQIHFYST